MNYLVNIGTSEEIDGRETDPLTLNMKDIEQVLRVLQEV